MKRINEMDFIEIADFSPEEPVKRSSEFYDQMALRRSIRSYAPVPIQKEILVQAIKTAGTAPSGANKQPWFFALILSLEMKQKIRHAAEQVELEFYNQRAPTKWLQDLKPLGTNSTKSHLTDASALIAVFSRTWVHEESKCSRSYYPIESTGIAVGFLIAALHNAGVASLTHTPKPSGFLNQLLGLDKSHRPFMIVATGYPSKPIHVPRLARKPLQEIMQEY